MPMVEVHAFNDTTYSSSSHFTPQPTSECLGQDDPFFCPSPSTSMSLSTPDSRTTLPNESSPAENNLPDLDESSATSSPSPDTPAQLSTVQQRWRRVACLHPGCDRQFVSAHTRRIHMRTHEPKARQYFPCTMGCSEAFSRQHDRMRHEVTKHGRECKWSCKLCRRFFSFEKTLKNHKCSGQGVSRWSIPKSDETA
ncbi:hypothetical protein BDZ97DRAFT_79063 [Flammula alnicola]|nr:hypothetical protein BDZ97DRAFT_79063 [Flammula alnicola]